MADKNAKPENKITSSYPAARVAPRKVVLVANEIRGKSAAEAIRFLDFNPKKASSIIVNVVKSGIANAKNTFGMKEEDIYIEDIQIGPGPTRRGGRIAGKSTFKPIAKRSTNIRVILGSMSGASINPVKVNEEKTDEQKS